MMACAPNRLVGAALALVVGLGGCGGSRNKPADGGTDNPDLATNLFVDPPDFAPYPDLYTPRNPDAACAAAKAKASPAKRPIDLIFIIDNSGSMANKIHGVEKNINDNLTVLLGNSGIDYRTIFITSHGLWTNNMICVAPPLSNNTCTPVVKVPPVNAARYFHYDVNVQSNDSFRRAIAGYRTPDTYRLAPNGWSAYLRPEALKVFVEVTDDQSDMTAVQFDFQLRAADPAMFGTEQKRNYIFHAIAGFKGNNPVTVPWGPNDPVQATKCGADAENNSEEYQNLAKMTGGLRFPICEWANFDGIFKEITKGVINGAKLACVIDMPEAPMGQMVDPDSLVVQYNSPLLNGFPVDFKKVDNLSQCQADSFYVENNQIKLCPPTCMRVQADTQADLSVFFDCIILG